MLSWRTARHISGLSVATVLVVGLLMPPSAQAAGTQLTGGTPGVVETQAPAKVSKQAIPTRPVAKRATPLAEESHEDDEHEVAAADHVVAELSRTDLKPFSMLGVTWEKGLEDDETLIEVRWRQIGEEGARTWSSWTELHVDPAPEEGGIPGTEPQWVDQADAAEVRVLSTAGARPEGLSLSTIDPQTSSSSTTTSSDPVDQAPVDETPETVPVATKVAKPAMISRAKWGASNSGSCDSPIYGKTTRGAVIHHTAGSNTYTKAQSAGIVKATQAYHKGSRAWCDIGYNFLVDQYGQIFEGRAGGTTKPVRAAHAGNGPVNEETMGVSMMGTFTSTTPSAAMKTAVVDLVAWRFDDYGIPGKGTYAIGGLTLNRIAGHRNVVSTECPGAKAYAWLSESGGLRDRVVAKLAAQSALPQLGGRQVSAISFTRFNLRWSRLAAAAKYQVHISTSATAPSACSTGCTVVKPANAAAPAFKVRGLSKSKTYHVWVRAIGSSGQALTAWQSAPKIVKLKAAPALPQLGGRQVSAISFTRFNLRWSRLAAAAKYQVHISTSATAPSACSTGCTVVKPANAAAPAFKVRGLSKSKTYHVWVRAIGSSGQALTAWQSAPKIVKLKVAPAAGEVGGRQVSALSYTRFNLAWRKFAGAASYHVQVSASSATPTSCSTGCTVVKPANAAAPTFPARGLSKGKTYYVWVRAVGSSGQALSVWQSKPKIVKLKVDPVANQNASANAIVVPSSRKVAMTGHGYGHGIGMSQYGAQGAAKKGVKYGPILAGYYPGTKLGTKTGSIRVLISEDTTDAVTIAGAAGLVFRDVSAGKTLNLPTSIGGKTVTGWQIVQVTSDKAQSTLQYTTNGTYQSYQATRWKGDGQFEGPSSIALIMPNGSSVRYRGAIRSALPSAGSTSRDTVNIVNIEHYVRGVIAAEMPSSWESQALNAQAVAARTYGVRSITSSGYHDICSTTSCQVYGGVARETTSTNAAAQATAGQILTYDGKPAFTQFSSSSGGFTAPGSQPYLKAVSDPYDNWSGNANHVWTASVPAATIEKAYPAVGTLKQLKVTKRNGSGDWGGRVTSLSVVGSKKTVTITGDDARWAFGLKSNWFRF